MKQSKSEDEKTAEGGAGQSSRPRRKKGARSRQPSGAQRLKTAHRIKDQAAHESQHLLDDAQQLLQTLKEGSQEAHATLVALSRERPYVVLGVAATTGFMMGRKLPLSLSRTALLFAGRLAVSAIMRQVGQRVLS